MAEEKKNEVAKITNEDLEMILNNDKGMSDVKVSFKPDIIKILNDLQKQAVYFVDGDSLTNKDVGKMLLDDNNRVADRKDLISEYEGTLLRLEYGHIVWETDEEGNPDKKEGYVGKFPGMVKNEHKEIWKMVNPDHFFSNVVRITMTDKAPEESVAAMKAGLNPFQVYMVAGKNNWGAWFGYQSKMSNALSSYPAFKGQDIILSRTVEPTFKIKITTEKVKNDQGESFAPVFEFSINNPGDILKFIELSQAIKEYKYFNDTYDDKGISDPLKDEVPEAQEAEVVSKEDSKKPEETDEEGLPF